MTQYVLSTMTNSVSYAFYQNVGDLPVMRDKVTIKGGAGLPSLKSGFGEMARDGEGLPIWTAAGMVTPLSDERFDVLKEHPLFKKHVDGGFLKVLSKDITGNHKEVERQVATMEKSDGFAQLTKDTIGAHTKVKVSTDSIDNDIQFRV